MTSISLQTTCLAGALALAALFAHPTLQAEDTMPAAALDVTMPDIAGKPYALSVNKGKVVMLVNVASHCGHTPQYAGLEKLYETYHDKGFLIIGVPANNFGGQEPGSNDEIQQFCTGTYHVTFQMLGKQSVKGDDICPLYSYLTTKSPKPGPITWNFAKFLVGRDGQVVDRFDPKTEPQDPTVIAAVEAALAKPAP